MSLILRKVKNVGCFVTFTFKGIGQKTILEQRLIQKRNFYKNGDFSEPGTNKEILRRVKGKDIILCLALLSQ